MSTTGLDSSPAVASSTRRRPREFTTAFVLVTGTVLIPAALVAIFNSWDAPDAAAYVRMAFAQVAGASIAIVTVAALVAQRIVRRRKLSDILTFALIAVVVTAFQIQAFSRASAFLLTGLDVVS